MKLWHLQRLPGFDADYDENQALVVRAIDAKSARKLAIDSANNVNEVEVWADSTKTACVELLAEGEQGVIVRDFMAG